MKNALLLFCFILLLITRGAAQPNAGVDSLATYSNSKAVNAASTKVLNAIKENKPAEEIAGNYFELAQALSGNGEHTKAELYMNKAIQLESGSKTKKNLPLYYRELARIQETQFKIDAASKSYSKAAEVTGDSLEKQLNRNDAERVLHKASPTAELQYLNMNGAILSNTTNSYEKWQNYTQSANTNMLLNRNDAALKNFRDALNTVDSSSDQSIRIKSDMVNVMTASNNFTDAITLQKEVVSEAKKNSNVETQVKQLRNLSELYLKLDSSAAALGTLKDAYQLAVAKGNLGGAKESLIALVAFYRKNKQDTAAVQLYGDFVSRLDQLITGDSSLIDKSLFLVNEGKIAELEQQQVLKDELLRRTNRSNFVLIASVVLLSTLLLLIVKAWFSIRKRNKQIALQSLRREMNPHFIFNSLNSVNQFIANSNEREANKYLSSYSNLMRNIMENSNKDYVALNVEIDQLKKYLELEKLRFPDKFDYQLDVDPELDMEAVLVPNMILQPNLENAIWHGLRYKPEKGLLKIEFRKNGNKTRVTIDDNGIGLTESKKIKTKNQKMHESLGLKNVEERIRLLNDIYHSEISFEITEKTGGESGVFVQLEW